MPPFMDDKTAEMGVFGLKMRLFLEQIIKRRDYLLTTSQQISASLTILNRNKLIFLPNKLINVITSYVLRFNY